MVSIRILMHSPSASLAGVECCLRELRRRHDLSLSLSLHFSPSSTVGIRYHVLLDFEYILTMTFRCFNVRTVNADNGEKKGQTHARRTEIQILTIDEDAMKYLAVVYGIVILLLGILWCAQRVFFQHTKMNNRTVYLIGNSHVRPRTVNIHIKR